MKEPFVFLFLHEPELKTADLLRARGSRLDDYVKRHFNFKIVLFTHIFKGRLVVFISQGTVLPMLSKKIMEWFLR